MPLNSGHSSPVSQWSAASYETGVDRVTAPASTGSCLDKVMEAYILFTLAKLLRHRHNDCHPASSGWE